MYITPIQGFITSTSKAIDSRTLYMVAYNGILNYQIH